MINRISNITGGVRRSFLLNVKDTPCITLHCHLALEDVLNTLVDKRFSKIGYIYTTKDIIIKIDNFSFKMNMPIVRKNLREFVRHIKHYINADKNTIEKLFLEYTDLKKIGVKYCNDCRLNRNCVAMSSYLENDK